MINRQLKFAEAIHEAIDICLERDRSTYVMGLGVPDPIGVFGTTKGLRDKHGEKRVFDVSCNGGRLRRTIELTIERLDFEHQGTPHSLQFHWVVDGGRGRGTNMHYVYSPGKGLVSLDEDD